MTQALTTEEKAALKQIKSELSTFEKQRGYLIPILQKVQEKLSLLLEHKIVALPAGANVIRMLPPLVIEKQQIDRVIDRSPVPACPASGDLHCCR